MAQRLIDEIDDDGDDTAGAESGEFGAESHLLSEHSQGRPSLLRLFSGFSRGASAAHIRGPQQPKSPRGCPPTGGLPGPEPTAIAQAHKSSSLPEFGAASAAPEADEGLRSRFLDASAAPTLAGPALPSPLPPPALDGRPGLKATALAVTNAGEASRADASVRDPCLALFVGCEALRQRCNAAARACGGLSAGPTADFYAGHLLAALRALEPLARGVGVAVAYTVVRAASLPRPLARGDVVVWPTYSFWTPSDRCASAAWSAGSVLLQATFSEGAWALPRSSPRARPPEAVAEPGWAFDVTCVGGNAGGAQFATLRQRPARPLARVTPLEGPEAGGPLEAALQAACEAVDAREVRRAASLLEGALARALRSTPNEPLLPAARYVRCALQAAWPQVYSCPGAPEAEAQRELAGLSEAQRFAAAYGLERVAERCAASQTLRWLAGAWRLAALGQRAGGLQLVAAASASGHPLALHALGAASEPADPAAAVRLYREAADAGSAQALVALGRALKRGCGAPRDLCEAARRFSVAADLGSVAGACQLGACLREGEGVARDPFAAVRLLRLGVDQRDAHAQYLTALCLRAGEGGLPCDSAAAARLLRLAADAGHAGAQSSLGVMLATGDGVDRDPAEAARLFGLSAAAGNALAEFNLGLCYEAGDGVRRDAREASRLFESAALKGNAGAAFRAGLCYRDGAGVRKDRDTAEKYLRAAAELGHPGAEQALRALSPSAGRGKYSHL
eukprot:m51a1_g4670 hypothetical protein (738) ;mRNA; f:115281-117556